MKQLLICRHSEAESPDPPVRDRDRKLTSRGQRDARAIGKEMARRGCTPEVILSSDSTRTRQTTALISKGFGFKPDITFLPELYSTSCGEIMNIVASCAAGARAILVVGHNPGIEQLVSRVAGQDLRLRPGTVAVFETGAEGESEDAPFEGLLLKDVFGPPVA